MNIEQLQTTGALWWPEDLGADGDRLVELLHSSFYGFVGVFAGIQPGFTARQILGVASQNGLRPGLFVKHLCVASDFGGELVQRLWNAGRYFFEGNNGAGTIDCLIEGDRFIVNLEDLSGERRRTNESLGLSADKLLRGDESVPDGLADLVSILFYGRSAINNKLRRFCRQTIGVSFMDWMGQNARDICGLMATKYIDVSRQTAGVIANGRGQALQRLVARQLEDTLGNEYEIILNGRVPLGGESQPFDIVVQLRGARGPIVGIEVAFQVTTNSTIERKSRAANDMCQGMAADGNAVAYLIDGAGNLFERAAAVRRICQAAGCVVSFSHQGLETLADFVRESCH